MQNKYKKIEEWSRMFGVIHLSMKKIIVEDCLNKEKLQNSHMKHRISTCGYIMGTCGYKGLWGTGSSKVGVSPKSGQS